MPIECGWPRWTGAPCTAGKREVICTARIASLGFSGRIDTTIGPANGGDDAPAMLVRNNRDPTTPSRMRARQAGRAAPLGDRSAARSDIRSVLAKPVIVAPAYLSRQQEAHKSIIMSNRCI